MDKNLKYWIAFTRFQKIGPARFKRIINYFPSAKEAWFASAGELQKAGIEEDLALDFSFQRKEINPDLEIEKLERENIKAITINDLSYPKILKEIYNPPFLLYIKGNLGVDEEYSLAVVGTRKISSYGRQVTEEIVSSLASNHLIIISGLALGVDALAHDTTLKAGGKTIAVLGSGLDRENIYPGANRYLADKIIANGGAVISEYPIGSLGLKHHFPQRNRIISGLALGTLVIEAGEESGALITAKFALEQNREVFAVPGSIYSQTSKGPNNLIKMGAKMVIKPEDILEELNLTEIKTFAANKKIIAETPEEEKLLKFLSKEPLHADELTRQTGLPSSRVASSLALMEMKGKVKNLGGMNYVIGR